MWHPFLQTCAPHLDQVAQSMVCAPWCTEYKGMRSVMRVQGCCVLALQGVGIYDKLSFDAISHERYCNFTLESEREELRYQRL